MSELTHEVSPQVGSVPVPDPTKLTQDAVDRATEQMHEYIDSQIDILKTRINGEDKATGLRLDQILHVPNLIKESVDHLANLVDERFASVAKQFLERDTRQERESRDNKTAVDAAFAASKEASAEQNKSNTLAITKSEIAQTETINKLSQLVDTQIGALSDKIDDLKERVGRIESLKVGQTEQRQEIRDAGTSSRGQTALIISVVLAGLTILMGILAIIGFNRSPAAAIYFSQLVSGLYGS